MIVVRLMGGLGNQMFQYAFGRNLALKYKMELVLDQTLLLDKSTPHELNTHRNYDLDIFENLNFRWATAKEVFDFNGDAHASFVKKVTRRVSQFISPNRVVVQQNNLITDSYFNVTGSTCFVGRWQSYQFFKEFEEQIKIDFALEKPKIEGLEELLVKIRTTTSVCLHVRRGDLVTSSLYSKTIGALELSYFTNAIQHINSSVSSPTYFVFSDDIAWCKKNILTQQPTFFVEDELAGEKAQGHFYLMQHCQHFIISNSTFAWWTAYLSDSAASKQVIYPKNWYKSQELFNPNMCPNTWVSL